MVMENREYYACKVCYQGKRGYWAWYTGENQGFLRDVAGRVIITPSRATLAEAVTQNGGLLVDNEPGFQEIDSIADWCLSDDASDPDCEEFLDAWSFLDDLSGLHQGGNATYDRLSRAANECFKKLFLRARLPVDCTTGQNYQAEWTSDELTTIRRVLSAGLQLLARTWEDSAPFP